MESISTYKKYKSSGVEWIGDVPESWKVKRIKNLSEIVNGSTPSSSVDEYWDGEIVWVTPADFNNHTKTISSSESKITEAGYKNCGTTLVPKNSIVLTTRAPIGNVLLAGKELCTNQGCKSIITKKIDPFFLYYFLSISDIELNVLGQGTTFLELSKESLGSFNVPVPEDKEQELIVNYLNKLTQKIDHLIANKIEQADKLRELRQVEINNAVTKGLKPNVEFKESGIEWLGKIPIHWKVKRLKNVALINPVKREQELEKVKDMDVVFLPMESVSETGDIDNSDKRKAIDLWEGFTYFKKDDVIIAKITPCFENGKGAWLNHLESSFGFGSTEFHVVRGNENQLDNQFFFFVSKSDVFMKIGEAFMTGTAGQKRVSTNFILSFKIGTPPVNEQIQIANYLKERITAFDKLIRNIETQIEKLRELRKIKIYNAVTGKIKVNAYAEATA